MSPSQSLNHVNVDMVTKHVLVAGMLAKVASQATLYNQWVHTMYANDVARNYPIGQMEQITLRILTQLTY